MRAHRIEKELLRLCHDTENGARLSRFEDWAATRSPAEVEYARHFLSTKSGSKPEDRRKDPRFPANCPLTIRNLTRRSEPQEGTLQDISSQGMLIQTCTACAINDAVEVSIQDAVFLGEAIHCRHDGHYCLVGLKVSHSLKQQDLAEVVEKFVAFF